jgi:membrane fusion protein (multidrug efflux system)
MHPERRPGLALLLAAGLALAPACDENATSREAPRVAADPNPVVEVETARIRRGSVVQRISAPGSIVARRESHIGTEVQGPVQEIFVREGDRVAEGDPLFQIDPVPYALALRRAEAARDRARAERHQLAEDLKRGRALHKQKIVAEQAADRIATSVEVAHAMEREAGEAVALAERNLERTLVRAPYAGSITRRLVDEGTTALVQPQTIVIVLQETHDLEAVATIAERHLTAVRPGDVALLHVDGLPLPIQTEVVSVGDAVDAASRTYRVKMPVPNADHRLKAGVFARIEIIPKAKSEVLLAPRDSVRSVDGRNHVLVVRDGRATLAPIEVGIVSEDAVEVLAGLRVDDAVIVGEAARTLGPGMSVRVVEAQPAEAQRAPAAQEGPGAQESPGAGS